MDQMESGGFICISCVFATCLISFFLAFLYVCFLHTYKCTLICTYVAYVYAYVYAHVRVYMSTFICGSHVPSKTLSQRNHPHAYMYAHAHMNINKSINTFKNNERARANIFTSKSIQLYSVYTYEHICFYLVIYIYIHM